jgi:hypothetical protein
MIKLEFASYRKEGIMRCTVALLFVGLFGCDASEGKSAPLTPVAQEQAVSQKGPAISDKRVTLLRTPDRGIQPQAIMDKGVVHLIYFKGDPGNGDVFYVKSTDEGKTFTKALRVNNVPGSLIATGNVRGAHLAIGAGGRAHVAWMGSSKAEPKAPGNASPMLYARLNDAGDAFEPQRNLIQAAVGLDGGGSIAANGNNVYVAWHAPPPGSKGEANRRVWLTASADEGQSFGKEEPISPETTGTCGCCGMRLFVTSAGQPLALYRGAQEAIHRDMFLLAAAPGASKFNFTKVGEWETGVCPMSTMAFADSPSQALAAWETDGQIFFARVDHKSGKPLTAVAAPGNGTKRRFPTIATNGQEVLLAWTEGMAWNRGGNLAWQVYDAKDQPAMNARTSDYGRAEGVPVWSVITAIALENGRFLILY